METSNSNSESEKVKPFEYECDENGTLTISRLVEEPIALSKAETDTWSFSITVPGRGIIEGIHLKGLKSRVRTLVVKGEVESIGEDVFSNCPSLENVELSSSLQSIGDNAFQRCEKLKSIEIPASVTSLGSYVFHRCSSLENVELSSSLQSIGDNAFQKCNTLRRIRIPAGVTRLGSSVFYECDDLEEIESESLRYPAEDGVLFKVADDGKKILVRYPSNRKGKHYTIPKDVVEIEEHAFAKCRNLKSIRIPKTVRKIGYGAFDTCWNLRLIFVSWLCPPKEIDRDIFARIPKPSKIQLIVPEGRTSAYCKADSVWKKCMVVEWSYPERSASYRLRLLRNVRSKISCSHVACRHKKRIAL